MGTLRHWEAEVCPLTQPASRVDNTGTQTQAFLPHPGALLPSGHFLEPTWPLGQGQGHVRELSYPSNTRQGPIKHTGQAREPRTRARASALLHTSHVSLSSPTSPSQPASCKKCGSYGWEETLELLPLPAGNAGKVTWLSCASVGWL
jgi:hypothetical protein